MDIELALFRFQRDPSDEKAWGTIVLWAYKPLVAYVASLLVDFNVSPTETPNDIVHDVLIKFQERGNLRKLHLKSSVELGRYLRRSCRNRLIDEYRQTQTAREFVDFLGLTFDEAFPDHHNIYREIFIREIIQLLKPECGEILKIYVTQQLTLAEMAEVRGSSPAAFNAKWYRCLEQAKEIFKSKKKSVSNVI